MIQQQDSTNYIQINNFVILVDNRNQKRLLKPSDHKNFKWRKMPIKLVQLQKFQYYQEIQVGNGKLIPVEEQFGQQPENDSDNDDEIIKQQNNREIYTLEKPQKLKQQQITQLKKNTNAGEIIDTIVSNNQQFQKRTIYSKQKYLAKKKRKYLFRFHVQPVSLDAVQLYHFQNQAKFVGNLRNDVFGFMLLQGSPYKRVLLAEQTKGIFLAALIIKQAENIVCYSQQPKTMKRFPIVEQMNIPRSVTENRVQFRNWSQFKQQSQNKSNNTYSNVIIFGSYNFEEIFTNIVDLLQPNCIICFGCMYLEPLSDVLKLMQENKDIVHIKLFDAWARTYQVLKNRTHPMMYMNSHPGYVLTAIRIK